MPRLCVLGLGYIGLPTASMFAVAGQTVIGVDPNPRVRAALASGRLPIEEPELETLVTAALQSGHLRVQAQPEPADVFIIAVPTPLEDKRPDLSFVKQAARDIAPLLRRGDLSSWSRPCLPVPRVPFWRRSWRRRACSRAAMCA